MPELLNPPKHRHVFIAIVAAQFCGTSLWFAGNAVLPQLQQDYGWLPETLGFITSATQLGFIFGTLSFALAGLSDRFSPSKLFFISSLIAASVNLIVLPDLANYVLVMSSRFLVGFFLAGIYPVGMKIASDWKAEGLGHWLGALVGALVLGTSFPHGLKLVPQFVEPRSLLIGISLLCVSGAVVLLALVPDGPYRRKGGTFSFSGVRKSFRIPSFRAPALGYFGHMWELYAFWAFVPWIIGHYQRENQTEFSTSLLSFIVIGSGALSCLAGGYWSLKAGSARVAAYALAGSGVCCLLSPIAWSFHPSLFIFFMIFWGITVVADSPQFSALIARHAPGQLRGSAITMVTCIGFTITIFSIQLLNYLQDHVPKEYLFVLLLPGPLLGLAALYPSLTRIPAPVPSPEEPS